MLTKMNIYDPTLLMRDEDTAHFIRAVLRPADNHPIIYYLSPTKEFLGYLEIIHTTYPFIKCKVNVALLNITKDLRSEYEFDLVLDKDTMEILRVNSLNRSILDVDVGLIHES